MPTIRPVAHDARLSLIEHLDELRTRLIWVVAVYVLAFSLCFAFNDKILNQLNKPLAAAKQVDCEKPREHADALEQTGCFGEELQNALEIAGPSLTDAATALKSLAAESGVSDSARSEAGAASVSLGKAAEALERAAAAAPEATPSHPTAAAPPPVARRPRRRRKQHRPTSRGAGNGGKRTSTWRTP